MNMLNYRSVTQTRNNHFPPKCGMFCLKDVQIVIHYFTAATALCEELEWFVPMRDRIVLFFRRMETPLCSQRIKGAFAQNLSRLY